MHNLEVIARMKIRPGEYEAFTSQVDEIVRTTREKDTHTMRCDFFVNEDRTVCEVHERFPNEQGLIEHKMNTLEPTMVLFRDHASDHQATIFGEVSEDFVNLVTERMGPPTVFDFVEGLDGPLPSSIGDGQLEVIARMKIRRGQLAGFRTLAGELVRLTRQLDTRTLRYDWFIDAAGTECEVHEAYVEPQGLVEHNIHVMEARATLFRNQAFDHQMSTYGELTQELRDLGTKHAGGFHEFKLLQGLQPAPTM